MTRPRARRAAAAVVLVAAALSGCSQGPTVPWVEAGPTADPTLRPAVATSEPPDDAVGEALADIERRLAAQRAEPMQSLPGVVSGKDARLEVVSVTSTDTAILLRLRLIPGGGEAIELDADGGLGGGLGRGNRSLADVHLVDDATGARVLPTVYRPDVAVEDSAERCLCSSLPTVLPADGLDLSVHYVRPAGGFDLVRVDAPGFDTGDPLPAD